MSGLPDTFPCPWCGMSYPARPVLVGKSVRCKGCRNGFVLQADGVASRIQEPPSPPPAAASFSPAASPRAPEPQLVEDVVVLPSPAMPPAQPRSERVAKRKTEHLEAARAQMAAQLAEIQQKAANSGEVKREERKSERLAKVGTAVPSSGEAKRSARHAVLTGEGERHHRESRLWLAWLGAAAVIALLLVFVFSLSSSARETLQRYAAPVAAELNRYPLLGDELRARAWLVSARSMENGPILATDLTDATFGAERSIAFEPLAATLAELKGLRLDPALGLWLAPAELDKARLLAAGRSGAEAAKLLIPARLRHVQHSQVLQKLGLADEDALIVVDLLTGVPPRDGEPIAKRLLDRGELPDRVVVRPFRGRHGSLLVDNGRPPYKPMQGPYVGSILRFEGSQWPIGWRVLHLGQAK
jgi:hypothetical protein